MNNTPVEGTIFHLEQAYPISERDRTETTNEVHGCFNGTKVELLPIAKKVPIAMATPYSGTENATAGMIVNEMIEEVVNEAMERVNVVLQERRDLTESARQELRDEAKNFFRNQIANQLQELTTQGQREEAPISASELAKNFIDGMKEPLTVMGGSGTIIGGLAYLSSSGKAASTMSLSTPSSIAGQHAATSIIGQHATTSVTTGLHHLFLAKAGSAAAASALGPAGLVLLGAALTIGYIAGNEASGMTKSEKIKLQNLTGKKIETSAKIANLEKELMEVLHKTGDDNPSVAIIKESIIKIKNSMSRIMLGAERDKGYLGDLNTTIDRALNTEINSYFQEEISKLLNQLITLHREVEQDFQQSAQT